MNKLFTVQKKETARDFPAQDFTFEFGYFD